MYIQSLLVILVHRSALIFADWLWPPPTPDPFESEFNWVPDDPQFDCIVPITYYKQKLNCGVFIRKNLIATSEIPLENLFKWPTYLKIYMIEGAYNSSKGMWGLHSVGDIWGKTYFWVYWGQGRYKHNPVHDLMFLYVDRIVGNTSNAVNRQPFYVPVARTYAIEEPSGWKTAAFAVTDWRHVEASSKLVPLYYNEPALVDCHEYIPKFWGHFICILNIDKYPVIQSGAPLIQNNRVFGVASFTLRRGKESVYAYTDLRPYRKLIYGFQKKFFDTPPPWWIGRR